jgi:hypothetical protein
VKNVQIYLKGWRDGSLYAEAANRSDHELHAEAMAMHGRSFQPYEAGDVMHLAFEYSLPYRSGWDESDGDAADLAVCNEAFEWFNVGENDVATRYRAAGNRSLSVGDVVVIDGRAYGCGRVGWDTLTDFKPTLAER